MFRSTVVGLFLSSCAHLSLAGGGLLYGTVMEKPEFGLGRPVKRAQIQVTCPRVSGPLMSQTDDFGGFKVQLPNIPTSDSCQMEIRSEGKLGAPFPLPNSSNSLKLNIEVDRNMNRLTPKQ